MWNPAGLGSIPLSRGRVEEAVKEAGGCGKCFPCRAEGREQADSYIPFRGKCYKNRVSGNPSAPPHVSGSGQFTSLGSASPGWDGLPRTLSGNLAEKTSEELLGKGHVSEVSKPPRIFTGN